MYILLNVIILCISYKLYLYYNQYMLLHFFLVLQYYRFSCSFPIILFFCHLQSHISPSPPLYCPQEHFCPQYYSSLFSTHRKQTNSDCVAGHVAEHNENLRPQESLGFITKVKNCHPYSS